MSYRDPRRRHPTWSHSVGAMIAAKAEARFACTTCRQVFDVELKLIARVKGRGFSLIDSWASCKLSRCGGQGFFIAAATRNCRLFPLVNEDHLHLWVVGPRPRDFEPPDQPSPIPPGGMRARPWHEAYGDTPLRLVG